MCTYGVVHLTECRIRSFSSFLFCFLSEICLCKNPIATYPFPFLLVQWGWAEVNSVECSGSFVFSSYFPPFSLSKITIERSQTAAVCPPTSYLPILILPARGCVNGSPDDSQASPPGPAPAQPCSQLVCTQVWYSLVLSSQATSLQREALLP